MFQLSYPVLRPTQSYQYTVHDKHESMKRREWILHVGLTPREFLFKLFLDHLVVANHMTRSYPRDRHFHSPLSIFQLPIIHCLPPNFAQLLLWNALGNMQTFYNNWCKISGANRVNYGQLRMPSKKLETADIHGAGVVIFFAGKQRCQKSTWKGFPGKDVLLFLCQTNIKYSPVVFAPKRWNRITLSHTFT